MKARLTILALLSMIILSISVIATPQWILKYNASFDGKSISDYSTSGGTWVIDSSGCYKGDCLRRTDSDSEQRVYLGNITGALDFDLYPVRITGWVYNNIYNDATYGGFGMYNISTNQWGTMAVSRGWNDPLNYGQYYFCYRGSNTNHCDTINRPYDNQSFGIWKFVDVYINNLSINAYYYFNGTNETGVFVGNYSGSLPRRAGYTVLGQSYRTTFFDEVSVYYYAEPPSILNLNSSLTDTINYNENDITIYYDGTVENAEEIFNCSLYVNSILNQTDYDINITNQQSFLVEWGTIEEDYTFYISCENAETSDNTATYTYSIDTILPLINEYSPLNNSEYTQTIDENITFSAYIFDGNYFARNSTIKYIDNDSIILNDFQDLFNETATTNETLNYSISPDDLSIGSYEWTIQVWDSHTNNEIFWEAVDIGNGYEYDTTIKIWSEDLTGYNANKETDRYEFEFTISGNPSDYKPIHLESTQPLLYVGNQYGYDNHFIDLANNKWIDFVSEDVEDSYIEKITDYHYIVYVKGTGNRYRFNSIGDLNTRFKTVNFDVIEYVAPPPYLISGIIRNIILIFVFVILSIVIFGLMSQITSGDVGIREVIISMAFSLLYAYFLSVWILSILNLT
jgi:hypothetical protein